MSVWLQCSSHNQPDSGLPCSALCMGSTNFLLICFPYLSWYHLAYASSIDIYVGMCEPGEWAYASFASPPYTLRFSWAAIAKNKHCIGCSTHDEYVIASACSIGAASFDPLQHSRALLVPFRFTLYCQCGRRIICLCFWSRRTGSPNIWSSVNWSICWVSPDFPLFPCVEVL